MFGERSARRRTKADGDELRASDAEREYVVDLLQRAVGQGMLDLDEFGQRTDIALAARTRAELNRVLLDLPIRDEPMRADTDEVLVLRSTLSEVSRRGNWRVPSRVLIISRLGSTKLDFTEAEFSVAQVTIELAEDATKWLIEHGYDEQMGARPMARLIQETIKKPLADEVLFGKLKAGGHVRVMLVKEESGEDKLAFEFPEGPVTPKPEKIPIRTRPKRRPGTHRRNKPSGPRGDGGPPSPRGSVPKVPLVKV